jgi:hypothetical protein
MSRFSDDLSSFEATTPLWVKIMLPLALTIAGYNIKSALSNEHRVTTVEEAVKVTAEKLDKIDGRTEHTVDVLESLSTTVNRLDAATAERNRLEALRQGGK